MTEKETNKSMFTELKQIFSPSEKRKLVGATVLQSSLAILDLIGVALIGVIGALSIYGIQSKTDSGRASQITSYLKIENLQQSMYILLYVIINWIIMMLVWIFFKFIKINIQLV